MKRQLSRILSLLLPVILLTGCWRQDTILEEGEQSELLTSEEQQPEEFTGFSLPERFALPYGPDRTLDPITCPDGMQQVVSSLLCEGLFRLGPDFEPEPWLCADWTYDETTLTYMLTLRPGTVFSDGTPLSSADVKVSLDRARISERYGARLSHITEITTDEGTVAITLSAPDTGFPALLDIPIAKAGTEEGSKERDQIINLKTGKVEYTAKEGETIVEGGLGYWEIDYELAWDYLGCEEHFFGTYLLDENYEMAFDGQLFGSVYLNGDYICGELEQDQFMRDIDRLKFNPLGLPGLKGLIWTAQGDDVYRTRSNLHVDILGIRGNTVAVQNDRGQYGYWKVEGSGSEAAITKRSNAGKRFNYWDAEDGFMRTCIDVDDTIYQLNMTNVPEDENKSTNYKAEAYRWGFVDRNMDLIVPYTYTYASETENGLAIVKNTDGQFAVIDLKRLGD
jgi:hypothetical protein